MATRSLWGTLLGRRGSNAEELSNEDMDQATQQEGSRRSHSQVETLCSMRAKPNKFGGSSCSSTSSTTKHASAAGSDGSPDSSPDPAAVRPTPSSVKLQFRQAPAPAANGSMNSSSTFTAASGGNKAAKGGNSSHTTGAAEGLPTSAQGQLQDNHNPEAPVQGAHDSASSTFDSSNSAGRLSRHSSSSNKALGAPAGHVEPSAPAEATATDAERTLSLSMGMPEHLSSSNAFAGHDPTAAALPAPAQHQHQHQQQGSASMCEMSFMPHPEALNPAGPFSTSPLQQPGFNTPTDSTTPRLSSPVAAGDLGLFSSPGRTGLGSGLFGLQQAPPSSQFGPSGPFGGGSDGGGGGGAPSMEALVADLQATAGLTPDQAAAAAAVMMQRMQPPPGPVHHFQNPNPPALNPWTASPPGQGFTTALGLNPAVPTSPMGHLHPGSNPDLSGFLVPGSPAAAAMGAFGGHLVGYDSVHSSSNTNVMSGSGYAFPAAAGGGLLSPEDSYLEEAAAYAHDGLDIPGTAQIAVHNVPFKWCNVDLEELFKGQDGYLDAQLLFHENGRSKGVGVGLFRDRGCAVEACNKLSGAQADGRKLELVLMNPDNHVSFSCRQVAVLGLPWEYTSTDVRALLEAAAEADGAEPSDAGVGAVEVAYRDDGKSEGRSIATFSSRRQAHDAIRRLHGKETLAGLRMRLFYLHEQQQTRNQHVLAQLRSQQQLMPGLLPGMANLALGTDTPSPRHMPSLSGTPSGNVVRQLAFSNSRPSGGVDGGGSGGSGSPPEGDTGGVVGNGSGAGAGEAQGDNEGEGGGAGGEGGGNSQAGVAAESRGGGTDEAPGSTRSSFEKDQGPVILHVSGLMESVTREQLRELFSQAGEVTKVDIPDGGRSMGYGFITFSNPQAAEQAMLLFNNYPLGSGAIHVAYSTSATAKARQQALRQARKATLGNACVSNDGGSSRQPGTPRGLSAAGAGRRGPGLPSFPSFPSNPSLGGLGGSFGALDPLQGLNPARRSFDQPGYAPPQMGGGWPRGGPNGGMGPMGLSSSLGALAGTSPGMHAGAGMGPGRNRRPSFEYNLGGMAPSQLQMLAGSGGSAGYPAGYGPGGFDVSTAGNLDQQLQLLMQLTGTAGDAGFGGPTPGLLGGLGGGQPGTPPPGGGLRTGLGAAGMFSAPMPAPAGHGLGGLGAPGGMPGLSTPPGPYPGAQGAAGFFGGNPATASAGQNVFSPAGLHPAPGLGGGGWGGLDAAASQGSAAQRHMLVTGLPPGLTENDLRTLFEVCGPLRAVSKQPEQDFAILTYDTLESARKAISALDGTKLPSGSTLSLQFTSLMPNAPETPAKTTDMPWNPAASPAAAHGWYGAGPPRGSAFGAGLATPPRSSFTGDDAPGGALHSGSLFPVAEAGNTGELFGGTFGGNVGGFSSYGGLGYLGPGLRVGASSPAFGKPPRDAMSSMSSGGGAAVAAASGLFRSGSPAAVGISAGSPAANRLGGPGPPAYAATLGISSSGSSGNLFGRAMGSDAAPGAGPAQGLSGRARTGSSGSSGGSAHGSDGAGAV